MTNHRHLLFFYGTLMSRESRAHVLGDLASPLGDATIEGDLFAVGTGYFPALLPGDGTVHGEVWEATDLAAMIAAVRITDQIEGYRSGDPRSMYLRIEVPILTLDGVEQDGMTAYTYQWNGGAPGEPIVSGSWREYAHGEVAA